MASLGTTSYRGIVNSSSFRHFDASSMNRAGGREEEPLFLSGASNHRCFALPSRLRRCQIAGTRFPSPLVSLLFLLSITHLILILRSSPRRLFPCLLSFLIFSSADECRRTLDLFLADFIFDVRVTSPFPFLFLTPIIPRA